MQLMRGKDAFLNDGTVITGYGLSLPTKAFKFGVWTPFRVVLPLL